MKQKAFFIVLKGYHLVKNKNLIKKADISFKWILAEFPHAPAIVKHFQFTLLLDIGVVLFLVKRTKNNTHAIYNCIYFDLDEIVPILSVKRNKLFLSDCKGLNLQTFKQLWGWGMSQVALKNKWMFGILNKTRQVVVRWIHSILNWAL